MNISKFFKKTAAVISAAALSLTLTFAVCAEDVDFDMTNVKTVEPWMNNPFTLDRYDATKMNENTEVKIEFTYEVVTELKEGDPAEPVELIVQSWSDPDTPMKNSSGGVWAKVAPYEWTDTSASFRYADMVEAYGTSDFSGVDAINIGATGYCNLTLTSMKIVNVDKGFYVGMSDAERAEAYKNALIAVLASALFLIIAIIVTFMIILKKKTSMTYDVTTGQYVKKK